LRSVAFPFARQAFDHSVSPFAFLVSAELGGAATNHRAAPLTTESAQ
jgi:hypothetical protein